MNQILLYTNNNTCTYAYPECHSSSEEVYVYIFIDNRFCTATFRCSVHADGQVSRSFPCRIMRGDNVIFAAVTTCTVYSITVKMRRKTAIILLHVRLNNYCV